MRKRKSAVQQWASVLIVLLVIGLIGCTPTPTQPPRATPTLELTPTQPPTATPEPTPILSSPPAPLTEPADETAIEAGKKLAVRASAARAYRYRWTLRGDGEIPEEGQTDVILYTAPEKGDTIGILTVTAYNDQGASPPTSLVINVVPSPARVIRLDALAVSLGWVTGTGVPESFIKLERSRAGCYTGSDCQRFTYEPGGEWGRVYWLPFSIREIMEIKCEEDEEWRQTYGGLLCTAFIEEQGRDGVQEDIHSIDVHKAGNLDTVNRLTFWVRGGQGGEIIEFRVGDANMPPVPGSSTGRLTLKPTWEQHMIELEGLDMAHSVGLFIWFATDTDNPEGAIFYLDDIQFEGVKEAREPPQSSRQNLTEPFTRLCWIAYSPTHFDPTTTPIQWPSEEDVREDLRVLRSAGFDGLVTYDSNYANQDAPSQMLDIPRLAQEAGFEGMIVGIWDPTDEDELRAAEYAARYPVVIGYSVGNEGLNVRYDLKTLVSAMERLRRATGKPVSTTEEVYDYYENSPLWTVSDWIFPNVHPYFAGYLDPRDAVKWTETIFKTLDPLSDRLLIFKEVGLPTGGGPDANEESRQAQYYQLLRETNVVYVVFEAFDAPWKHLGRPTPDRTYPQPDPEPHWGIFTSDRLPKQAATGICPVR